MCASSLGTKEGTKQTPKTCLTSQPATIDSTPPLLIKFVQTCAGLSTARFVHEIGRYYDPESALSVDECHALRTIPINAM
ncbi:hypothetical protein BAE44_0008574 [Dichanthelium oligosanthes]|uniref:Uncharacterized protein n=1 Tax=Dichanthelium oligosanthes TaxID=888268 RepID=A0A1E5VZ66_9POAL|nr:hypothetical protein BAE44_0008574 [Dichanthelium oligosanthes]